MSPWCYQLSVDSPVEQGLLAASLAARGTLGWQDLARLPDLELAKVDIAVMNLACAADLPSTEKLDAAACLRVIDEWTRAIGQETERRLPRFRSTGYDSEAQWRVSLMIALLARTFGVRHNPAKVSLDVPLDVADTFLHGILWGNGGTCASLPVLYAAVGRRLGYPIKLAKTQGESLNQPGRRVGHCFARWEGSDGERFNIDVWDGRFCSPPDDYYRTAYQVTPEAEQVLGLIRSLTPKEELALFLENRAYCWLDLEQHRQAVYALIPACALDPCPGSFNTLALFLGQWHDRLMRQRPPVMPALTIQLPPRQFFPALPEELERRLLHVNALDLLLQKPEYRQRWWDPMRQRFGHLPADLPGQIVVQYRTDGVDIVFHERTERQDRMWQELHNRMRGKYHV